MNRLQKDLGRVVSQKYLATNSTAFPSSSLHQHQRRIRRRKDGPRSRRGDLINVGVKELELTSRHN